MYATHIELIVDGKIVDMNRIKLPADTLIVDERFGGEWGAATKQQPENQQSESSAETKPASK